MYAPSCQSKFPCLCQLSWRLKPILILKINDVFNIIIPITRVHVYLVSVCLCVCVASLCVCVICVCVCGICVCVSRRGRSWTRSPCVCRRTVCLQGRAQRSANVTCGVSSERAMRPCAPPSRRCWL